MHLPPLPHFTQIVVSFFLAHSSKFNCLNVTHKKGGVAFVWWWVGPDVGGCGGRGGGVCFMNKSKK